MYSGKLNKDAGWSADVFFATDNIRRERRFWGRCLARVSFGTENTTVCLTPTRPASTIFYCHVTTPPIHDQICRKRRQDSKKARADAKAKLCRPVVCQLEAAYVIRDHQTFLHKEKRVHGRREIDLSATNGIIPITCTECRSNNTSIALYSRWSLLCFSLWWCQKEAQLIILDYLQLQALNLHAKVQGRSWNFSDWFERLPIEWEVPMPNERGSFISPTPTLGNLPDESRACRRKGFVLQGTIVHSLFVNHIHKGKIQSSRIVKPGQWRRSLKSVMKKSLETDSRVAAKKEQQITPSFMINQREMRPKKGNDWLFFPGCCPRNSPLSIPDRVLCSSKSTRMSFWRRTFVFCHFLGRDLTNEREINQSFARCHNGGHWAVQKSGPSSLVSAALINERKSSSFSWLAWYVWIFRFSGFWLTIYFPAFRLYCAIFSTVNWRRESWIETSSFLQKKQLLATKASLYEVFHQQKRKKTGEKRHYTNWVSPPVWLIIKKRKPGAQKPHFR